MKSLSDLPRLLAMLVVAASIASASLVVAYAQEPAGAAAVAAIESALVEAIAKAEPSVVAIARVRRGQRQDPSETFSRLQPTSPAATNPAFVPNEYGTGVVVDRRGLVLTPYHVLGEDSDLYVTTSDRRVFAAKVKAADPRSDLAVLSIDAADLAPIAFGDAGTLRKGQIVVALGNPYAIARDGQASASWGIVANLARKAPRDEPPDAASAGQVTLAQLGGLIQTDAKLNLGTSGGPLVNLRGEMVGLVTALAATAGYEQSAGYAVPVDDAFARIVETLKSGREVEYGLLGVRPQPLPIDRRLAGVHGALPGNIVPASPAERAGLKPDDVITHVNAQPVYDADGLMLHVGRQPAGAEVKLTVLRGTGSSMLVTRLAKYGVVGRKVVTTPSASWRGLRVDWWTAQLGPAGELPRAIAGAGYVVAADVAVDSPAWQAGLRPGVAITHVNDAPVAAPEDFFRAVEGRAGEVKLRLASADSPERKAETVSIPAEPAE